MNWNEALTRIRVNIKPDLDIDLDSDFRTIKEIQYPNNGERVYLVRIGTSTNIKISESMLETLFEASLRNGGMYSGDIFRRHFPKEAFAHPCHVHVVGKILVEAGAARQVDKNNYEINA